jgi:hypothetical protein
MSARECAVVGCPGRAVARGLCARHYAQARKSGALPALTKGRYVRVYLTEIEIEWLEFFERCRPVRESAVGPRTPELERLLALRLIAKDHERNTVAITDIGLAALRDDEAPTTTPDQPGRVPDHPAPPPAGTSDA